MKIQLIIFSVLLTVQTGRIARQSSNTVIEIVCSACKERLEKTPNQVCCRCIREDATCNNDLGEPSRTPLLPIEEFPVRGGRSERGSLRAGLACDDSYNCLLFKDCPSGPACMVAGVNVIEEDNGISVRSGIDDGQSCPPGQLLCCDPVPGDILEVRLGLVSQGNPLGESESVIRNTRDVCHDQDLSATQNFALGVTCGRRDSRAYYDASLPDGYTNPGEWPWVVLLFSNGEYIGAGAMLDNDVVVTVGHKVKDYTRDPSSLTVRMGDWNPNFRDDKEEHPAVDRKVDCVRLHPDADLESTLANNLAVLKLSNEFEKHTTNESPIEEKVEEKKVFSVVNLRSAPHRDGLTPEGEEEYSFTEIEIDQRSGLVSQLTAFDGLGGRKSIVEPSYINTVCLPQTERQFENFKGDCWLAAWGDDLERQREVNLPLVNKTECERKLRPVFESKGIKNWELKPSEICAGGEKNKDSCKGEGGAPIVCLDQEREQFFAIGLVNYGFGCNTELPAVYTNLADPNIKRFIAESFSNSRFCQK